MRCLPRRPTKLPHRQNGCDHLHADKSGGVNRGDGRDPLSPAHQCIKAPLADPDAGAQAGPGRHDRAGEQNGTRHLGHRVMKKPSTKDSWSPPSNVLR